jgi:hypothetical protein
MNATTVEPKYVRLKSHIGATTLMSQFHSERRQKKEGANAIIALAIAGL